MKFMSSTPKRAVDEGRWDETIVSTMGLARNGTVMMETRKNYFPQGLRDIVDVDDDERENKNVFLIAPLERLTFVRDPLVGLDSEMKFASAWAPDKVLL